MLGLMSTVFFLTPAHAEPTASAHASVRPVMVLDAIIGFSFDYSGGCPCRSGLTLYLQARGRSALQNRADQRNQSVMPGRICIAPTLSRLTPNERRLPRIKE